MSKIIINSQVDVLPGRLPDFDQFTVKNEPMLFNCDLQGARNLTGPLSGPITNAVLNALPSTWREAPLVIDTRVHMLMPGWYPCIPGWHHDDVPRTRADGQPNYEDLGGNRSEHIVVLINGDICPTEFALGEQEFNIPPIGEVVYEKWHHEMERRLNPSGPEYLIPETGLNRWTCPSNRLVKFNDRTWHRGTKARSGGWRYFFRASRYFNAAGESIPRGNPRTNETRRQVQVYLDDPNKGW